MLSFGKFHELLLRLGARVRNMLTMPLLRVRCLGAFSFSADEKWTAGPAFKRGREFLQYLISYPRAAASRDTLIATFWPALDSDTAVHRLHLAAAGARAALRALSLEIDGIRCSGRAYAWDPSIPIESDAERLLAASRGTGSIDEQKDAAALYQGEFLAGEDAEWMYPLRVRCANAYAVILERLAKEAFARDAYAETLEHALLLLETDPAHEGATRLAMRSFAAMGRRGAALASFDALATYLQHHLALKPSPRTNEVRASIVDDQAVGPTR